MKRLTDKEKREICRLYYSGEKTKAELARSFNVSHTAISKILNDDEVAGSFKSLTDETSTECQLSMLAFLESKKTVAQELISIALSSVKEKISKASLKDTINAIEKLSIVFKDSGAGQDGSGNGNANELRIVVEKKVVDLTKGEDDADN